MLECGKRGITIPIDEVQRNHLEFQVTEEKNGTFTVTEYTAGSAPMLRYTGFPNRREAERFVLAQPYPWEE